MNVYCDDANSGQLIAVYEKSEVLGGCFEVDSAFLQKSQPGA